MQHEMHPKPQSKPNYLTSSAIKWHPQPPPPRWHPHLQLLRQVEVDGEVRPSGSKLLELISGSLNFLRSHRGHQQRGIIKRQSSNRRCYGFRSDTPKL